jgi:hypothetical protein
MDRRAGEFPVRGAFGWECHIKPLSLRRGGQVHRDGVANVTPHDSQTQGPFTRELLDPLRRGERRMRLVMERS